MKKYTQPLLALSLSAPLLISQMAYAADDSDEVTVSKPKFNFFTSLGVLNVEGKDFDPESFETEVGLSGMVKAKEFKMIYNLTAELSGAINSQDTGGTGGSDDIHIKEVNAIFPTAFGTIVLAPRVVSGQNKDLYSNVDLFEYNETHSNTTATPTGNTLYGQPSEGDDLIAWVSPKYKGIKLVAAALSINEDNDKDLDVKAFRAVYDQGAFNFGIGTVITNKKLASSDEDYTRSAITAGYKIDGFHVGATYEVNDDTFGTSGDYNTLGVASRYYFDDEYSLAAGYYKKDSDVEANDDDGVVLQLKKEVGKNVSFWVEGASYDKAADNFAMGVNLRY